MHLFHAHVLKTKGKRERKKGKKIFLESTISFIVFIYSLLSVHFFQRPHAPTFFPSKCLLYIDGGVPEESPVCALALFCSTPFGGILLNGGIPIDPRKREKKDRFRFFFFLPSNLNGSSSSSQRILYINILSLLAFAPTLTQLLYIYCTVRRCVWCVCDRSRRNLFLFGGHLFLRPAPLSVRAHPRRRKKTSSLPPNWVWVHWKISRQLLGRDVDIFTC